METRETKRLLILDHETWFAQTLASRVLARPKLSVWMVLIPIIFVYYFYQFQKVMEGRKQFTDHYLKSRVRALDAAVEALETGERPDAEALASLSDVPASLSDVPEEVRPLQTEFLSILVEHYTGLLRAEGGDFVSLIRSSYRNRTNYLLLLNRLTRAEGKVNEALRPRLEKTQADVENVIRTVEEGSESIRRELAETIFP
jgi:hypothetical protein